MSLTSAASDIVVSRGVARFRNGKRRGTAVPR